MTTQRDAYIQEVRHIRSELNRILAGMDYCLDWKPSDEEWSAREVLYHIIDTPQGGIHATLQGILKGDVTELSVTSSLTNMDDGRQAKELNAVLEDANAVLEELEEVLTTTADDSLMERRVPVHSVKRGITEERTAQIILERMFINHWRNHMKQMAALREMLGVE